MRFKFVVNHKDNTLRCLYDDKLIDMIENIGEIVSIKRISDIEPNKEYGWTIQYRIPKFDIEHQSMNHAYRSEALAYEHGIVEKHILESPLCKEFLGKAD